MEIKNDGRLKICWMRIVGYQQFQDVFLDFTHPETGEPLDKICLIGANGTGKTVVLEMLKSVVTGHHWNKRLPLDIGSSVLMLKFLIGDRNYLIVNQGYPTYYQLSDIDSVRLVQSERDSLFTILKSISNPENKSGEYSLFYYQSLILQAKRVNRLLSWVPSESVQNTYLDIVDVPQTTLDQARGSFSSTREFACISSSEVVDFWNSLIWHLDMRRENRSRFDAIPENKQRILGDLDRQFDSEHPKILEKLALVWNRILTKAGLSFDFENAKEPFRLVDNLHAYIVLNATRSKIEYSQLSSGIRNFIFRLGHIFVFRGKEGSRMRVLLGNKTYKVLKTL